jgi:hypothetical protein
MFQNSLVIVRLSGNSSLLDIMYYFNKVISLITFALVK